MRKSDFLKDESGAVQIIEAAVIYPIVITAVLAMLWLGMYVLESALVSDRAKAAADMAAKTLVFSGCDELGDIYSSCGFKISDEHPDVKAVERAYDRNNPYRYFITGKADERFSSLTEEYASGLLFPTSDVTCTINVKRRMFDREVEVTAEKYISVPGVFRLIGLDEHMKISASASAVTSDPAEFIRNTDLAVNAADILGDMTGAGEKISDIRSRLSGILEKIKAGMR